MISRRQVIDWLFCTAVLMLAYAGRGWLLAWLLEGRYLWTSLFLDVMVLGGIICVLRSLDLGLHLWFQRLLERKRPVTDKEEIPSPNVERTPANAAPRSWRLLLGTARFVMVFVFAAPFLVTLSQLHPQRIACAMNPGDFGMSYEDVSLECDGLILSAWYIAGKESPEQAVVFITHGVGANKQNFLPVARRLHEWGYPVFLLDFRAHGDSEGLLSTLGKREANDVKVALVWLAERHPGQPIYGLGYSMGAAALVGASADGSLCDLYILDSMFARLENSARQTMSTYYIPTPLIGPWWQATRFWGLVFVGTDLEGIQPEQQIGILAERPLLLIHGTEDGTTSFRDSLRLQELTDGKANCWLIEGAGHLQAVGHPDYYPRIRRFLDSGSRESLSRR